MTSQVRQGSVPLQGPVRTEWIADLHRAGRNQEEVWSLWLLDALRVVNGHLTEQGEVLGDNGSATPYYLTPDEWDEVAKAAEAMTSLARCVGSSLRYPK